MNDKQRTFLLDKIKQKFDIEMEALTQALSKPPSLNNYLIAAALDGSLEYRSIDEIKESIRQMVLNLGPGDNLLGSEANKLFYGGNKAKENAMAIDPKILFQYPANYLEAKEKYDKEYSEYKEKRRNLTNLKETLEMKINLGSNAILDKLISQADNLADLNLVNNSLILTAPDTEAKQIEHE